MLALTETSGSTNEAHFWRCLSLFFFFDFICIPEHVCSTKTSRPWPLHDEEGGNGGCMRAVLDHCSQLGSQVPYQRRLAGVYPSWWGSGPGRPRTQGGPSRYAVVLIPAVGHAASSPPRPTNPRPPNFLLTRLFQIATPRAQPRRFATYSTLGTARRRLRPKEMLLRRRLHT